MMNGLTSTARTMSPLDGMKMMIQIGGQMKPPQSLMLQLHLQHLRPRFSVAAKEKARASSPLALSAPTAAANSTALMTVHLENVAMSQLPLLSNSLPPPSFLRRTMKSTGLTLMSTVAK